MLLAAMSSGCILVVGCFDALWVIFDQYIPGHSKRMPAWGMGYKCGGKSSQPESL